MMNRSKLPSVSVLERRFWRIVRRGACALCAGALGVMAQPIEPSNRLIQDAQSAWTRHDGTALASLRNEALKLRHPLAMWVDYWELQGRLNTASSPELDAFFARWPNTYVEDRLRNDWLLELGRRRDFSAFAQQWPLFRMKDDRELDCWAQLMNFRQGLDVAAAARAAWMAQRDADDGCQAMATDLYTAHVLNDTDVWRKARQGTEAGRPRVVRFSASLIRPDAAQAVDDLFQNPALFLVKKANLNDPVNIELTALALVRLAVADPEMAVSSLKNRWAKNLPPATLKWVWTAVAKQSAIKLLPNADAYFQESDIAARGLPPEADADIADDALPWKVRAALRANVDGIRWQQVIQAINAMTPSQQQEPAWVYWKARALSALAKNSQEGDALQAQAQTLLGSIASQTHFYGILAAETLGQSFKLPPKPPALTTLDRAHAAEQPGLWRALELIHAGLRSEGVREWNYTVGWGSVEGWSDRELRAIAQLACDHQIWDRCIYTSEKARKEIDMAQRFPLPQQSQIVRAAAYAGLEPAYVFGLIRQESRFITDARSGVGATGLMQVMPTTARWTAKRIGLRFNNGMLTDSDVNLKLGTSYLKLLVDDFGGSFPMATAGYNAGPNRPRRWREGFVMDAVAWTENIPFTETRDYVKKVLANTTVYSALLDAPQPSLRARLGERIGPPPPNTPPADLGLP
jgi:soluble lytic murein transglycosylase